jgi:predicted metal-dependent hydrolase
MIAPFLSKRAVGAVGSPDKTGIHVRDRRFLRGRRLARWWAGDDPIATAWNTALSATFPRGEAFFIECVKAHRDGAPPLLAAEIRAFVAQEVNHSREHLALNRAAEAAGYDLSPIDARVVEMLEKAAERTPIQNLAATMALEHFTAIMAHELLVNPAHLAGSDPEIAALWRWHAVEEIEHKAVAFDTFRNATRDWPAARRYLLRALMMLVVTRTFFAHRVLDALELLRQDGLTGWRVRGRLAAYLLWKPGVLRRIFAAWFAWFRPGFHPWDHDDRALIATVEAPAAEAA